MKTSNTPEDHKLVSLLRAERPAPVLPPRFEENVWRRIEADEPKSARDEPAWLLDLAGWWLKPGHALVVAAVVVLAGAGVGWSSAQQRADREAQARYLAAVAPNALR